MKFRWHAIFLLLGGGAAIWFAMLPRSPIWKIHDTRNVNYAGFDSASKTWRMVVHDIETKECWLELRMRLSANVTDRLKLKLPYIKGNSLYVYASTLWQDAPLVVVDYQNELKYDQHRVEQRTWILNSQTGEPLLQEPILQVGLPQYEFHGSRLAIRDKNRILLIEGNHTTTRTIDCKTRPQRIRFSLDGRYLLSVESEQLSLIDWTTLKRHDQPFQKYLYDARFLSPDLVLANRGAGSSLELVRLRWNGNKFSIASPGLVVEASSIGEKYRWLPNGLLQLSRASDNDWPYYIRPFLEWLEANKVPVRQWFAKSPRQGWLVVDEQDKIVREFNEPINWWRLPIYDQLAVEINTQKDGSTNISLWNHAPVWPNALAIGLVVYLLLYLLGRIRNSAKRVAAWRPHP